ncbi:major facilitator superfamily domain-containing protein [Cercophora scortea]|uniref:Major facilitator superfamily domain-containing protein n=1 Tax=Cercophora scortea TaxID=314031 RepID=A0AAE0MIK8_9PEZI|nr:major facilitator superfamily domain-containing protein [Cercophora scortea]
MSRAARVLRQARSNNGYGCDEDDDNDDDTTSPSPEEEEEKDPYEIGWDDGDNDPLNPRSMPHWRKWVIVIITSFGAFCVTNASASYTATYTQMTLEFHTTKLIATIGLSMFVLGIAMGPFWSPLAEFYGRRPIYLASFLLFTVWIIPSAVAQNIATMNVARFFQGLAGSAFLSVSGGTVGDLFNRESMSLPMTIFSVAPFDPVLLKRKAEKVRKETGDDRWKAPMEKTSKSVTRTVAYSLLRPFQLLIMEPMCLILDIYSAILLGVLYLFFGAFPLVFVNNHGFNLWQVGLTFMGLLVASILAALSTPFWHRLRYDLAEKRGQKTGIVKAEPEDQLPPVILGAPLITAGLFLFGFTTYPWVHWIFPIIGSGIFGLGTMLAFTGIFTFLVDAYPRYAASALAGNAFVRCTFAAAFPLFGVQMYERLGYQWASGLLAFLTLAMLPFPYLFFVYGKRIRARSKFATSS